MKIMFKNFSTLGVMALILTGCASMSSPVLFQLVDERSNTHAGSYSVLNQSMNVTIDNKNFNGFYIVGQAVKTGESFGRRFHMIDTFETITSNSAKAYMSSKDGEKITCDFLFERQRAIGECKSSLGKTYQFVADGK